MEMTTVKSALLPLSGIDINLTGADPSALILATGWARASQATPLLLSRNCIGVWLGVCSLSKTRLSSLFEQFDRVLNGCWLFGSVTAVPMHRLLRHTLCVHPAFIGSLGAEVQHSLLTCPVRRHGHVHSVVRQTSIGFVDLRCLVRGLIHFLHQR